MVAGLFDATEFGQPMILTHAEDEPVYLTPGKTFVLLAPGAGSQAAGVTAGSMGVGVGGEVREFAF